MPDIAPPIAAAVSAPDAARLFPGLDRDWVVLPAAQLGGAPPVTIDAVLLHPARGIVLLEEPPRWTPDAPARLERCLAQTRFRAAFPGHLPVVHASLPRGAMISLPMLLASGFAAQAPLDLPGRGTWLEAARRALLAPAAGMPGQPPGRGRAAWIGFGGLALASSLVGALLVHQLAAPDLAGPATAAAPPPGRAAATIRLAGFVSPSAQARLRPAAPSGAEAAALPAGPTEGGEEAEVEAGPLDAAPLPPPGPPVLAAAPPSLAAAPGAPGAPVVLRDLPALALPAGPAAPALVAMIGAPTATPPAALHEFLAVAPSLLPAPPLAPQRLAAAEAAGEGAALPATAPEAMPEATPATVPEAAVAAVDVAAPAPAPEAPAPPAPGPAAPQAQLQAASTQAAATQAAPTLAAAPPAALPPARPAIDQARVAALLRRGDALLGLGDVSGARRFYERAAEAGSAEGARAAGRTQDPAVLAGLGARGIRADPAAAEAWYRRADALAAAETGR
ncbi:hypothetical protein [Roseicella frigidaeris]|uniref:Sel1 repeat family protein n=1 Tax=Roseicella frigidaeris TaxID=2230885 RepID=A0A327M6S4_9PROT|nr:hypothetical protein [Roseicella frigidaeris]RAI58157.1 hypothetical protein DOO78_15615 [Roseicella frigidaeris]